MLLKTKQSKAVKKGKGQSLYTDHMRKNMLIIETKKYLCWNCQQNLFCLLYFYYRKSILGWPKTYLMCFKMY